MRTETIFHVVLLPESVMEPARIVRSVRAPKPMAMYDAYAALDQRRQNVWFLSLHSSYSAVGNTRQE